MGDTISFVFATALTGSSGGFSIYTNATTYTDPPSIFIDSSNNSVSVDIFGPAGPATTPLPSTWTMLIAGFVGLGFFAYRGSKNRSAATAAA